MAGVGRADRLAKSEEAARKAVDLDPSSPAAWAELGHVLSRAGYQTSYIGKWHMWANELGHHDLTRNGFVPPGPYRMGFDQYWAA